MTGAAGCASTTGCASATVGSCRASAAARRGSTVDVASRDAEASAAPCEAPLVVVAVLAPARGALDERRLVGMDASALSTLAGARGHGWRHPADMETNRPTPAYRARDPSKRNSLPRGGEGLLPLPRGPRRRRGRSRRGRRRTSNTSTPRVGSAKRTGAPAARAGASVARAGTSAARAASVVDCLVAGASASAPGDSSPAIGAGSGDGGAGSHLSGRTCPLSSSSSSSYSSSDDEYSSVPGEESPCCSRS
jgi:hypothetical protein